MALPSRHQLPFLITLTFVCLAAIPARASLTPVSWDADAVPVLATMERPSLTTEAPRVARSEPDVPLSYVATDDGDFALDLRGSNWNTRPGSMISPSRGITWGTINALGGAAALLQSQSSWGESRGHFHFKHDFKGDGMAMSDEASHMFAAYHLQQVLNAGYKWTGVESSRARRLATLEAWLWMFAIEYPIDAYNPSQGFGVSDLLFNTAGVIAAHVRSTQSEPRWDVKISVKPSFFQGGSRVIAYTDKQYDDYVYWVTYRPLRNRYVPLLVGLGYGTNHELNRGIAKEVHFGIGTSLPDLGGIFGPSVKRYLSPLSFFYFNINGKVVWR